MEISDKFKKSIFKKLYKDLSHVEIIPYGNSIWFIDRENKYWYFEYGLNGILFFRYPFFNSFFSLFSLESDDYRLIMSEWVEEVLNHKAHTTRGWEGGDVSLVEEVLNCKVLTTVLKRFNCFWVVEEVLNCKVLTTRPSQYAPLLSVEEVLNCKVLTTKSRLLTFITSVEEVLNCKVKKTELTTFISEETIKNVLEYSVPEVRIPLEKVLNDNG